MFSRDEKFILFFLALIQFSHIVDFMIMMPLGPQVMRDLGLSPTQFGLVISSYTFSGGIMGFIAAFFLDRFERKKVLLALNIGFATGTILCALSPSFLVLIFARAVAGAFGGIMGSVVFAVIGDSISLEKRGTATGIVMTAFSVASIVGVPFSLYLATKSNWHAPFFLLGGISGLLSVLIFFKFPTLHAQAKNFNSISNVKKLLSHRETSLLLLFIGLLIFGHFTIVPFISPALVFNGGMEEAQLPLVYLVGGSCTIIIGPIVGRLSDRFSPKRVAITSIFLSLIPIYLLTHLSQMSIFVLLVITGSFFIVMNGRMVPTMTMMSSSVPTEVRGSFMSLTSSVQQLTSALAATVSGSIVITLSDGTLGRYGAVGFLAMFSSVFAALLLMRLRPRIA